WHPTTRRPEVRPRRWKEACCQTGHRPVTTCVASPHIFTGRRERFHLVSKLGQRWRLVKITSELYRSPLMPVRDTECSASAEQGQTGLAHDAGHTHPENCRCHRFAYREDDSRRRVKAGREIGAGS